MKDRIDADLEALAEATQRGLPSLDETTRALRLARSRPTGGTLMSLSRRPVLVFTLGAAALALALVCPVPYTRTLGYDLTVRANDGHVASVRLPRVSREQAERRAEALRARGAAVSVAPRTERVWGALYAMASDKLLHVDVRTGGRTDAEIEKEVRAQIEQSGWAPDGVTVQRDGEATVVAIDANDGEGRVVSLVGKGDRGRVTMRAGDLDDRREPGMTDEQLRQKILRQLEARGMVGEVTVVGDRIDIRAHPRAE